MEENETTIKEIEKSQAVRVWDMAVVAPVLIYAGMTKSNLPKPLQYALIWLGVSTLLYNGNNFIKNLKNK